MLWLRAGRYQCWISRRSYRRSAYRFDVRHKLIHLFFAYQSLKHRHDVFKSGNYFRARTHYRFPDIVLIGDDGATIFQGYGIAVHANKGRPATLSFKLMACGASKLRELAFSSGCERAESSAARHPRLIIGWLHHHDLPDHSRVHGAAVLGAE